MSGGRVELGLGAGWFERGAHGVRHPVPAARRALRPARGAARDHHRAVGDPGRRDVRLRRQALPARRLARRCPSRCSGPARRSSSAARGPKRTPRAGRPVRRRVQPAVRLGRGHRARSSTGSARPASEVGRDPDDAASAPTRWCSACGARRGRGGPPGRRDRPRRRTSCARTGWPARPPRWSTRSAGTPRSGSRAALPPGARPRRPRPPASWSPPR